MSYCRFQNTLQDLRDCKNALEDNANKGDMGIEEFRAMRDLVELCIEISSSYKHDEFEESEWTNNDECDCEACDRGDFENCEG